MTPKTYGNIFFIITAVVFLPVLIAALISHSLVDAFYFITNRSLFMLFVIAVLFFTTALVLEIKHRFIT